MSRPRHTWALAPVAAVALLCGCAAPGPRTQPAPAAAAPAPDPVPAWQAAERERARTAQAAADPVAARQAWAAVLALQPGDAEAAAGLARAQAAQREAAATHQRRAAEARARGDIEGAMSQHLRALALDPLLADSAAALRELELQRHTRSTTPARAAAPAWPEEAELLLGDGDIAGALRLVEPLAAAARPEAPIRQRVCDLLLRQADAAADAAAARDALQRCLRLLPRHTAAQQRLRQLR